jgi:hypothetical protein
MAILETELFRGREKMKREQVRMEEGIHGERDSIANEKQWLSSKEVAERTGIHIRTLRRYLDQLHRYIDLRRNSSGHYLIDEETILLLSRVKKKKVSTTQNLKGIVERLVIEAGIKTAEEIERLRSDDDELATTELSNENNESPLYAIENSPMTENSAVEQHLEQLQEMMGYLKQKFEDQQHILLKRIEEIEERQHMLQQKTRTLQFDVQVLAQAEKKAANRKRGWASLLFWRNKPAEM